MGTSEEAAAVAGRRVLITGGSGFIGRHLVRRAGAAGWRLRLLSRRNVAVAPYSGAEIWRGDLTRPHTLTGVAREVEAVIHCAGVLGNWCATEAELYDVNVRGSLALLEQCAGAGVTHFVHVSAGGVTGPITGPVADEGAPCRPVTAYERSKYEAEVVMLRRATELGVPLSVVRPTFTYGPEDRHKLGLFRAVRRRRFAFIGGGESVIHPVYVDDLVTGLLAVLDRARPGEVYILGGKQPITKRVLVAAIAEALGVSGPRLSVPRAFAWRVACVLEWVGRRAGFEPLLTRSRVMMMADNYGYSIAKAERELGYVPRTDVREGMRLTAEWYREKGWV